MLKLENQGQKKCNNDHHTSMLYSRLLLDTITNFIFFSFFLSFFFFFFSLLYLRTEFLESISKQLKESHHFQDSFVLTFEEEYYTALIIQTMHIYIVTIFTFQQKPFRTYFLVTLLSPWKLYFCMTWTCIFPFKFINFSC